MTSTYIVATIYHGPRVLGLDDGSEMKYTTEMKEFIHVKKDQFIDERPGDEKYGRYLRYGEEIFWNKNFHQFLSNHREDEDLLLLLEVFETWDDEIDMEADNRSDASKRGFLQEFTPLEKENKYRLHGYSVLKINNENGTIKYGNYTIDLFKPPINTRRRLIKDMLPDE